jgi:hypothetical protein
MSRVVLFSLLVATGCACAQEDSRVASFTWEERLQHYVHRTYSWQRMTLLAADTGFDHLLSPNEWGRGPESFGYRYGAGFGRRIVRNSIELGLGFALDEDLRFRPSSLKGFRNRIGYSVRHAFLASRGELAYARFAASAGGALVGTAFQSAPASQVLQGIGFDMAGHLQNSLLAEFSPDLKRFATRLRKGLLGR